MKKITTIVLKNKLNESTSQSEHSADKRKRQSRGSVAQRFVATFLVIAALLFGGTQSSEWHPGSRQTLVSPGQQTAQGVVAKQSALVNEIVVNGLKVLGKRREGSLYVAAGLIILVA